MHLGFGPRTNGYLPVQAHTVRILLVLERENLVDDGDTHTPTGDTLLVERAHAQPRVRA